MTTSDLAYWSAGIEGRTDVDPEAVAIMVAHPRFADACWMMIGKMLERYRRPGVANGFGRDVSRLFYGLLVIYLDARGGITPTAIEDLCRAAGIASPGRARVILLHLRAIGYIRSDPANKDRRSRRYVVSAEMRTVVHEIIVDQLRAFSLIEPAAAVAADRFEEAAFCRAFFLRLGAGILEGMKIRPIRPSSHFVQSTAGGLILLDILASAKMRDTYPPRESLRMSVAELARKYRVSRSHVFRLLHEAEKRGLLRRDADDQTGFIEDALADDLREFYVTIFMGLAACCHQAFRATRADERASNASR